MMRILSFDQSRPRGHPSAGRKQMLDQELRQPRFIALGLPALFHDQHPIEIIKRSIYYSIGQMLVNRCSPGELLTGRVLLASLREESQFIVARGNRAQLEAS